MGLCGSMKLHALGKELNERAGLVFDEMCPAYWKWIWLEAGILLKLSKLGHFLITYLLLFGEISLQESQLQEESFPCSLLGLMFLAL